MGMGMRMVQIATLSREFATGSMFVRAERLLFSHSDYQKALEYIAPKSGMEQYRSVLDFLFIALNPEWSRSCKRFYSGHGRPLRDIIKGAEYIFVPYHDARLVAALRVARQLYKEHQAEMDWDGFLEVADTSFLLAVA